MAFPLREFMGGRPLGLAEFERFQRHLPILFESFADRLGQAVQAGGFQVETEAGRFKLRASLPGYQMYGEQAEQPLSVKVVGRSLVVKGHKQDGRMVSTFQRSFQLPKVADVDQISVTYNNADGALAVDIPPKPGVEAKDDGEGLDMWTFDSQDGGSHTTVHLSSGHAGGMRSVVGELLGIMEESLEGSSPAPGAEVVGRKEAHVAPMPESSPGAPVAHEAPSAQPSSGPVPASAPTQGPATLVQPKDALPFWHIVEPDASPEGPFIEIVAPQGFEVGKPQGQQVPVYRRASPEAEGHPVGQVELPVRVMDKDCIWAEGGVPGQRVLRCKILGEAVKKLHIKVADEL